MKIKTIESSNGNDFRAIYECEHCGHTRAGFGYDDDNFYTNVIPNMECGVCGNKRDKKLTP